MDMSKYRLWTELEWTKQFRKEETNLKSYFEELEKHLDLPDEDDLIYQGLHKKNLINDNVSSPEKALFYEDEDIESDASDLDIHSFGKESGLYFEMGEVALDLCRDIAFSEIKSFNEVILFLMQTGRAMTLYYDYLQLGESEDFPELKKAIIRKEISLANDLLEIISKIKSVLTDEQLERYLNRLHTLREKLIDIKFTM